jgi:hypothetical protein
VLAVPACNMVVAVRHVLSPETCDVLARPETRCLVGLNNAMYLPDRSKTRHIARSSPRHVVLLFPGVVSCILALRVLTALGTALEQI